MKARLCSQCGSGPKHIHYHHPETKNYICRSCYRKIKDKIKLQQWFLDLSLPEAANWILGVAQDILQQKPCLPKAIQDLNRLVEWQPDKIREILKEIHRPAYPVASKIIRQFEETEEGRKLKSLISG